MPVSDFALSERSQQSLVSGVGVCGQHWREVGNCAVQQLLSSCEPPASCIVDTQTHTHTRIDQCTSSSQCVYWVARYKVCLNCIKLPIDLRLKLFYRCTNTTNKIKKMIDVFHLRCLRSILGISWRDHITNDEVMARSEQMALQDTVATRRRRFVGHILRLPTTRPVSLALEWIPEDGRRRVGRPRRTWQDTLKEDLDTQGVDWSDARDTADDRARWRQLVAQCSAQNGRN